MRAIAKFPVIQEKRSVTYSILIKVWLIVAVYAILHDQYIVRLAPEHFTIYHAPLLGIEHPETLAAASAFGASFSPGLLLGFACALVARTGSWPRLNVNFVIRGVTAVVIATELVAAFSGYSVSKRGIGIYPNSWYPGQALPLLITQTIQVTCYFSGALFSSVLLGIMIFVRYKNDKNRTESGR